jgi:hypothetical protein
MRTSATKTKATKEIYFYMPTEAFRVDLIVLAAV